MSLKSTTPTPTPAPTTKLISTPSSTSPTVRPTPVAGCDYWVLEIFDIENWATDGGGGLQSQEQGAGAVTGYYRTASTLTTGAKADFNLPFFIGSGCVERVLAQAGGPQLLCQ